MNKKDECEITRDLANKFIENSLSKGSENFIKKHLQICDECKKYYQNINLNQNNEHDEIVVNQFKKINRHINILKISLISIFVIILVLSLTYFVRYKNFQKLVNTAYEKIQYMKQLDNYKIKMTTIDKNFKTGQSSDSERIYYYKDGNYKIEDFDSISFYKDDSYDSTIVFHSLKQITYYNNEIIKYRKGDLINMFTDVVTYKNISSSIYSLVFSIREARYNGMDCYVIKNGSKDSYRETWINKDNYITVRVINEDIDSFYREVIYEFTENVVTDDDVDSSILDTNTFNDYIRQNIVNHATELDKSFYEIYHKE